MNIRDQSTSATSSQRPDTSRFAGLPDWLAIVAEKAEAVRFGTIQITVHEARVVQIDSTERTRLEADRGAA